MWVEEHQVQPTTQATKLDAPRVETTHFMWVERHLRLTKTSHKLDAPRIE
jgi:hypothetical protein